MKEHTTQGTIPKTESGSNMAGGDMTPSSALKVEHYDASEVAAKKMKILKTVATGVGAAALTTLLGCYGCAKGPDSTSVKNDLDTAPETEPIEDAPMRTFMVGGNGAWFNSVIEFLDA